MGGRALRDVLRQEWQEVPQGSVSKQGQRGLLSEAWLY